MHPALRPENLSSLSPNLQRVASSTAIDNFIGLSNSLGNSRYQALSFLASPATVLPLLPVWYKNLDPLGLPNPDDISTAQALGRTIDTVVVALLSLQVIPALRKAPPGVYPELWARVWPWIEFLHIHREHLLALPTKSKLNQIFMKIFVHFQGFGCRELVAATAGVCAVVGSTWDSSLDSGDEDALSNVSVFVHWEANDSDFGPIDGYLEGVGGGIEHLAAMLIKHLSHAIADGVTPMLELRRSHFGAVIYFIARVTKSNDDLVQRFSDAVIHRGIISALITGILCLTPVVGDQPSQRELLRIALNHLGRYSTASPGLSNMCKALQAGLLHALVLVASLEPHTEQLHGQLNFFFNKGLPSYMALVDADAFKNSPQWTAWQALRTVVQDRLDFVQEFDSRTNVRYKACDNMECQHIRECQTADWRAGHRDDCQTFSGLRRLPEEEQCNMKDRVFLRALIRRDYVLHRRQIYTQQILTWARNPTQLSYVLFDYMHGAPSVAVRPWPRDHSEMLEHPLDWERRHYNYGCRAAKSQLLEVHLMAIPNGSKTHWKFMPMRYTGTEILDGLWAIVDKVTEVPGTADPNLEAAIVAEVEPLLAMNPQIIHE
ncbi:hypothetical protein DFH06DRAFT_1342592 [Mycena polygramma]|nr:hypothetical protein DFH06DRAFT_1342592 [Mycena polygramma]